MLKSEVYFTQSFITQAPSYQTSVYYKDDLIKRVFYICDSKSEASSFRAGLHAKAKTALDSLKEKILAYEKLMPSRIFFRDNAFRYTGRCHNYTSQPVF